MPFIQIFCILPLAFFLDNSYASQYAEENLFEVRANSNIRSGLANDSDVVGILFGGFVVAADPIREGVSRSRLLESSKYMPTGYVSSALLADPSTSYRVNEINNGVHKVKHFEPRTDLINVWPQEHARIYDLEGNFISNLPRVEDLVGAVGIDHVRLSGFDSQSPYYSIALYDQSYEPGPRLLKFLSKEPFGELVFSVGTEVQFVDYNAEKGDFEFSTLDRTYEYWLYSGAASPYPEVSLKLADGKLVVADDLMKAPAPSEEHFLSMVGLLPRFDSEMTRRDLDDSLGQLTGLMLDLMYSGHPNAARELLMRAWPDGVILKALKNMSRSDFELELADLVRSSDYFRPWMLEANN